MEDKQIELIYNTFLRISRTKNNKPFRYRKDFNGFENEKPYLTALKLKSFFNRNPQIKMEDFFTAPYVVFEGEQENYYDFTFYNSLQAIKVYTLYNKKIMMEDPDTTIQLQKIQEGLKFIKSFCIDNKIQLKDYLAFRSQQTNDFLIHLSYKYISIYNLFPLKDLDRYLNSYDFELLSFILKDTASRISYFRTKFLASKKAKSLATIGLKKIEEIIKKQLEIKK